MTAMYLPDDDQAFLQREGYEYDVFNEGGMLCVQLNNVGLPQGLSSSTADILLRLAPLYPDAPPDMWWMSPALKTATGAVIPATEVQETHRGRTWQRWSRHLPPGSWLAGTDTLESYLALIHAQLYEAAGAPA